MLVRFLTKEANGFVACLSVLVATATPLLMVGATLLTIDALSVMFWVAAMITGWQAVQRDSTSEWLWTGLWMGLGFLSKYTALFQWLSWVVLFLLWPKARLQLRRPGPYLALLVNALCLLPVLIWNAQHHWVTVSHLATRGGLDHSWQPTLRYFWDFIVAEALVLNPIFLIGTIWAAASLWRRREQSALLPYLFSMGAPLALFYLAYTLRARVQPNWIAPAVLPLFCLMVNDWGEKLRAGSALLKGSLMAGLFLGWLIVVPLHDTQLIAKVAGRPLSWKLEPLTRVLGWKGTADVVRQARLDLEKEHKPVFIIGGHYGITSILSFYMPEARTNLAQVPLVYCVSSAEPENQFYFWPGYSARKGQNAIYVAPPDRPDSKPPRCVEQEFGSITDLGESEILYKGRMFHHVHLFACRNLR
jgi:4-amino-4-deoxy-L-arabinose transferase-like glycosyltransferase